VYHKPFKVVKPPSGLENTNSLAPKGWPRKGTLNLIINWPEVFCSNPVTIVLVLKSKSKGFWSQVTAEPLGTHCSAFSTFNSVGYISPVE